MGILTRVVMRAIPPAPFRGVSWTSYYQSTPILGSTQSSAATVAPREGMPGYGTVITDRDWQ